jgi:hypothetical protein
LPLCSSSCALGFCGIKRHAFGKHGPSCLRILFANDFFPSRPISGGLTHSAESFPAIRDNHGDSLFKIMYALLDDNASFSQK